MPTQPADPVAEALLRLYGEPLERFLAARKELAAGLRAAGQAEAARAVAAAPKPTRTAWALDQVARREPTAVAAMLEARDAAAAAPGRGDAAALRAALRDFRGRLGEVLDLARDMLAAAGFEANATQLRRMGETLQAASVPGSEARARLQAGTLAQDVGVEDPFGGLEAGAAAAPTQASAHARARPEARAREPERARGQEREREERARRQAAVDSAQQRVTALEAEAREAGEAARAAETAAFHADKEVVRAQRDAERARKDAERARQAADEAGSRVARARADLKALRSS
jgi:hypothetical protein